MNASSPSADLVKNSPFGSARATEVIARVVAADVSLELDPKFHVVHAWLRTTNVATTMQDELWRMLRLRVACLNDLCRWVWDSDSYPSDDGPLRFWLDGAQGAVTWWNQGDGARDLTTPANDAPSDDLQPHAVLWTTVWETLVDWMGPLSVSLAVRDAIDSCAHMAQQWCAGIPVPPCRARAWNLDQYVHRCHGLAEILPVLRAELETWDDLVLEDFADEMGQQARDCCAGQAAFSAARFTAARDSLLAACGELFIGWPVESDRLQMASRALSAAIPTGLSADSLLVGAFDPLHVVLASLDATLAAHQNACAHRLRPPVAEDSIAMASCTTDVCRAGLLNIASWINRAGVDVMAPIRTELAKLVEKIRDDSESGDRSGIGRDLLSLLVDVDAQLAESLGPPRDLSLLRDQLRRVLVESFPYQVLDAASLVGRPFDDLRDRVRVRRAQPGGLSGHVVHVHRPGYVFQFADGRTSVIRPAEVDVSE